MDKPTNFAKCYAILGIFPDDDWATVRNAYQRQIRRWHPDRFQNRSHQELAEEKTKELNYAYHELSNYHRRYGALPPDGTSNRTAHPVPQNDMAHFNDEAHLQSADNWIDTPLANTEPVARRQRRIGGPAAVITLLALAFLVWGDLWHTAPEYDDSGFTTEIDAVKPGKDLPMELFGRQPGPDKTAIRVRDTGRSSIPDTSRMQANEFTSSLSPTDEPALDPNPASGFGHGSSKSEVLAAQGPPYRQTEHVWYYGTSRVYFRNGKVAGWYESPSNPFGIARDTDTKPANDAANSADTLPGASSP